MAWTADEQARLSRAERGWANRPRPPAARWFPVILSAIIQVPGVIIALHDARQDALSLVFVLVAFAASFVLLAAREHPGVVVAVIGLLCAPAIAVSAGPPFAAVPLALAVVSAVVRGARVWAWGTLAGLAVLGPLAAYLLSAQPTASIRPLIVALILLLLVGVGEAIRNRRDRYRELSRTIAARRESAAEAERLRIARELHDVLAHSLSQISVQAGVGLHLFDSRPEKARESLEAIKATSSQALEEVRGVLGFLRSEGDGAARAPEPDIDRIPSLVETYQRAGLDVRYDNALTSVPAPAIQLAIYRIVQESLTNVGRHAQASTVHVSLRQDDRDYIVSVADDGRGLPEGIEEPGGKGVLGMRERAELLGGRFEAVPGGPAGAARGVTVTARIPIRTAATP
ncbi:sensor histidine kinase [Leifsonia sp. NCR5]|uniref:sensor histidine kinase n=1 Tax=Leifsonia sp. NCR5 TaxID=1978342 RepID=UPI000A195E60|nr:sensor histidine kinase [Leifsonia sp. NCR5]